MLSASSRFFRRMFAGQVWGFLVYKEHVKVKKKREWSMQKTRVQHFELFSAFWTFDIFAKTLELCDLIHQMISLLCETSVWEGWSKTEAWVPNIEGEKSITRSRTAMKITIILINQCWIPKTLLIRSNGCSARETVFVLPLQFKGWFRGVQHEMV